MKTARLYEGFQLFLQSADPKSLIDGMAESWNGRKSPQILKDGITEWRKIPPNPKRWSRGITEQRKIPPNPKRQNDGKSAEIVIDGIL